jgi:hypothetical protein
VYTEDAWYELLAFDGGEGIVEPRASAENGVTTLRFAPGMNVNIEARALPPESGVYKFQWKDAEFPSSDGFPVRVEVADKRVRIINERTHREVPVGELADGELMWHVKSGQWILGHAESDALAPSVGGCDGADPFVVDFKTRVVWTCMWGP